MTRADVPAACWMHCTRCTLDFRLGVSVPCAVAIYLAALKVVRCPSCGKRGKNLQAYSPGLPPALAREVRL
jgi:hypothetical protein